MGYQRILDISDRGEVRFFEAPANGKEYVALRAPADLDATQTITLRSGDRTAAGTSYVVVDSDRYVYIDDDTAGGDVTVTLPPAADNAGRDLSVKKLGTTGQVTITPNGSELIDGAATLVLLSQYDAPHLRCDGSGWHIQ